MTKQPGMETGPAELNSGSCSVQRLLGFLWFCLQSLYFIIVTPLLCVVWAILVLWEHLPDLGDELSEIYSTWLSNFRKESRKLYSANNKTRIKK
jgi:hypothetical protein